MTLIFSTRAISKEGKAMYFVKLGQSVFAAALLAAILAFPASAWDRRWQDGQGEDEQGRRWTVGAPGPVAGVGLTSVALVGGYIWFVRSRQQRKAKKQPE